MDHLHQEKKHNTNVFVVPQEINPIYRGSLLSNVVRSSSTTIRPQTSINFVKPPVDSFKKSKEIPLNQKINFTIDKSKDHRKRSTIIDAIHVDFPLENMKEKRSEIHQEEINH